MNKLLSPKITALTFGVLTVCFAVAFYVIAWEEPLQGPPGGAIENLVVGSVTIKGDGTPSPNLYAADAAKLEGSTKDELLAAAGGGGAAVWRIAATSATYTGNLGGYDGANAKCRTEFGDSAIFLNTTIFSSAMQGGTPIYLDFDFTAFDYAWFSALSWALQGETTYGNETLRLPSNWNYTAANYYANCGGWRNGNAGYYGLTLRRDALGSVYYQLGCDQSKPLLCAIPE